MSMGKTLVGIVMSGAAALVAVDKAVADPILYDDFSSGALDTSKWSEVQDTEGQPLTEQHYVDISAQNYHIAQINPGEHRTYLLPTTPFQSGDTLDFDMTFHSADSVGGLMMLVNDGSLWNRHGVVGVGDFLFGSAFGDYHLNLQFFDNLIMISGDGPYGTLGPAVLNNHATAPYSMRIGGYASSTVHLDMDNFYTNQVPEPATLSLLLVGILAAGALKRKEFK